MNDEGTAPSLAAGAVPFLMWDETSGPLADRRGASGIRASQSEFFSLLDISTLKKVAIGVQLCM